MTVFIAKSLWMSSIIFFSKLLAVKWLDQRICNTNWTQGRLSQVKCVQNLLDEEKTSGPLLPDGRCTWASSSRSHPLIGSFSPNSNQGCRSYPLLSKFQRGQCLPFLISLFSLPSYDWIYHPSKPSKVPNHNVGIFRISGKNESPEWRY